MVGVPGKYKGCNTCRLRRVKCDNTRPICKKCTDSGRECGGYERKRIFIIGTPEDGGRCSSHPPRVVKSSKKAKAAAARTGEGERLELVPEEPLRPAWDDLISLSNQGKNYQVQIAALHTPLQMLVRAKAESDDEGETGRFTLMSLAPYEPPNVQPLPKDEDFELRAQCLVHLSAVEETHGGSGEMNTDSLCLFLYEHNSSLLFSSQPPWKDPAVQHDLIRRKGPDYFQTFPNHHFFVRVYRHNAICNALLNRKPTFLAGPEWLTAPWERHKKSFFDRLFDIIALLPSIFYRADSIFPLDPTVPRRLMAQDLLSNCLNVEAQLDQWLSSVYANANANDGIGGGGNDDPSVMQMTTSLFRVEEPDGSETQIPFTHTLTFRNGLTALMFIHYWAALVLFHQCIDRLHAVISERLVDVWGPQTYTSLENTLPIPQQQPLPLSGLIPHIPPNIPNIQLPNPLPHPHPHHPATAAGSPAFAHDPNKYTAKETRELAAMVCRSLDFALAATTQPDALAAPLAVVQDFYGDISAQAGDGQLELMWCEAFRVRLAARGQDVADVVAGRKWRDLAAY